MEAASRSLDKPTTQRIDDMVKQIVEHKITDHQLDECHLTLNEIRRASAAMAATVKNMLHSRISYPSKKEKSSVSGPIGPIGKAKRRCDSPRFGSGLKRRSRFYRAHFPLGWAAWSLF